MIGNYATNFALIDREADTVSNIIWGMIYQEAEFNTDSQFVVQIDDLSVNIGDSYDGESFYHEGEKVKSRAEEMVDMVNALEILGVEA